MFFFFRRVRKIIQLPCYARDWETEITDIFWLCTKMWIQGTAKGTKDGGKILFWGWLAPSLCKHSDVSKNSNVRLFSLICFSIFSNFATSLLSRIAFSGNGPHFAVNWGKIISFLPFSTFYLLQCKSSTVWLLSELNNVLLLHSIVLYCRPIAWWEISVDFLVAIYKRLMLQQLSAAPCRDIEGDMSPSPRPVIIVLQSFSCHRLQWWYRVSHKTLKQGRYHFTKSQARV